MPSEAGPTARVPLRARLLLVAVLGTLVAMPGAFVRSTQGGLVAVDEPQYLLTAISLVEDGSLDIDDELDAARWRAFHDATLPRQTAERPDGSQVAPHDPLLPVLLAGPWALGGVTGARWFLALVNGALAAALLHAAVRRFAVPQCLATVGALVAAASVPFVVYGNQLYPELPAALAVTLAVDLALAPRSRRATAGIVLLVVALPWLGVKYAPVAAVLAGLHLLDLRRRGDRRWVATAVGAWVAAGLAYVVLHLVWYGGVTVYAAGDFFVEEGSQLAVLGTNPSPLGRTRRLAGLLVDRGFGVAAWQPAWLALAPAVGAVTAARHLERRWVLAPLVTGWVGATWFAVTMHGFWFPGRHVLHVLPLAVLAILWWAGDLGPRGRTVLGAAAGFGVWSTVALLVAGLASEITWVVGFTEVDHPGYRLWRLVLPDGVLRPAGTDLLTIAWTAALVGAAVLAWRRRRQPPKVPTSSADSPSAS